MVKRSRPSSPAPIILSTSRRSSTHSNTIATLPPPPLPPINRHLQQIDHDNDNDSLSSLSPPNSNNSSASPPTPPLPSHLLSAHINDDDVNDNDNEDIDDDKEEDDLFSPSLPSDLSLLPPPPPPPRATIGGKGQAGETALNKAVAAREDVERRRVEYGGVSASSNSKLIGEQIGAEKEREALMMERKRKNSLKTVMGGGGGEEMEIDEDGMMRKDGLELLLGGEKGVEVAEQEEDIPLTTKRKERPALIEERSNIIKFTTVTNDGSPHSLILLTGLKNIFQKQLPKMPREYIARLVYDRNHYSMAIVKRGLEVVGGITYRPFEAREFAEIVFCAITGTEQVKGYGSHLMNHLKDHVKATTPRCRHFLTYADNYAIGYFKKQGFTKEITLDRSVWAGYIKDYEGGTIMHCSMLDRIKYLDVTNILTLQKDRVLSEIRQVSQSHIIHSGLDYFKGKLAGQSLVINPSDVPGLKESGWTPEMDELTRRPKRGPQFSIMQRLLTVMGDHPSAWAFDHPVNADEVTDYYDMIKQPMDLATMSRKLEANTYTVLDEFLSDARLIFSNCRSYNDAGSNYVKFANKLEGFMDEQVKIYLE